MTRRIYGSNPRTFPVGAPRHEFGFVDEVYSDVGDYVVPEGMVLVVPEHSVRCSTTTRHEYGAGTRFRVVRSGDIYSRAVTDILS